MMENGLYMFYQSYVKFHYELKETSNLIDRDYTSDLVPLTMKQFRRAMLFFLSLYGLTIIVFLAEILTHKWLNWRNR